VPSLEFDEKLGGWAEVEEIQEDARQQSAFTNQLLHFAAVLRGDAEPASGLVDNFNTIACVEAIVQSARTGRRVEVPTW
jgi:predicted dehydrogenase